MEAKRSTREKKKKDEILEADLERLYYPRELERVTKPIKIRTSTEGRG
jgi:hypothetical protein